MLERIPQGALGWRPHPKSMTLAHLASHIAEIPRWVRPTLLQDEMAFDPSTFKPTIYESTDAIVAALDSALADAQDAMKGYSDQNLAHIWRLKAGGKTVFEMPRAGVLRVMILNHTIHHRGQLSVYLRLQDVPLPAIYGPSADDPGM
jgi:uncharacterized damage-inducible protein DinB